MYFGFECIHNGDVKAENYFDHAATTRVAPEVFEAMRPWFTEFWGNAHSAHSMGMKAHDAVENARALIAELVGAEDPDQIIFTSGSTEACNVVLKAFSPEIWVSPFEHSAIRVPACRMGCPRIPNDGFVMTPPSDAKALAVMKVNNETGAVFSPRMVEGAFVFSDVTQAVGKIAIDSSEFDAAALSAHKFHGPQGVGALYMRDPSMISCEKALIEGGSHEHGLRGGTLNVPGIVGMGAAARLAMDTMDERFAHVSELRSVFIDEIEKSGLTDYQFNFCDVPAAPMSQVPHVVSMTIFDLVAAVMLVELDSMGFGISSGPACSSKNPNPSPVLEAVGLDPLEAQATLRVSFGCDNTVDSTVALAREIVSQAGRLRL